MNLKPIKRINFVEYHAKLNTLGASPLVPKYGTPLLAAIMKEKGYDSRILLEGVSDLSFENITDCDLLCFPVYMPLMNKIKECALRVRRERPDIPIILGGPMISMLPLAMIDDHIFSLGDYVVRCEGDDVLPELAECLNSGGDRKKVNGVSFKEGATIIHNPDRTPPEIPHTVPDPSLIEGFEKARRGMNRFKFVNLLQTSRGCAYKCNFCPTDKLFGGTYRNRDIDSVIRDIKERRRYRPMFFVVDNSFLSNRKRTAELLRRMVEEDLRSAFIVFERHEIANDAELLALMREAGIVSIIVGIESLDDENLAYYNKKQTSSKVRKAVQKILDSGIHVIGTFMLGGDADTKEKTGDIIAFVKKTGISPNLFIMHDCELDENKKHIMPFNRRFQTYYRKQDPDNTDYYDYMTGNFVTYFPKRMKPSTLQKSVIDVYRELYAHRRILKNIFSSNIFASIFGVAQGYLFKRMNDNIGAVVDNYYMDYLKKIEDGLYDEHEVLIEEKLDSLAEIPIPRPLEEQTDTASYNLLIALGTLPGFIRFTFAYLFRITSKIPGRPALTEVGAAVSGERV